jgi:RNA polymerase sigma-70 factor (ECF subfamily)
LAFVFRYYSIKGYIHLSDQQLLPLFKNGDREAYSEIFERYSRLLLRHTFRLLNDKAEAHDVVQDVFLMLWQKRDSLDSELALSSFLYTSVRNRIFNLLYHQKVVIKYAESFNRFAVEGSNITEDTVREHELAKIIEREIAHLPERMRQVFLLNKKHGLSYHQIAEQLNISPDTARQQVYKAVKILKPKIDEFLSLFPFL